MPDMREKLVEQKIKGGADSICPKCFHSKVCRARDNQPCVECNQFVDANGVTVQRWIPVTERLPEPFEAVLVYDSSDKYVSVAYMTRHQEWVGITMKSDVTHWMPLLEPPKGE